MKKIIVLLLCLCTLIGKAQVLHNMIDEGWGKLTGRNCGPANIEEARKKFITAKRLGFYNSRIRKRASEGLSRYQLIKGDTAEATNILEKLIGNAVNTNIKAGRFERISKTKKQQWAKYGAAQALVDIYIARKQYTLASNYLTYFEKHVNVIWTCGTGVIQHNKFIKEARGKISACKP